MQGESVICPLLPTHALFAHPLLSLLISSLQLVMVMVSVDSRFLILLRVGDRASAWNWLSEIIAQILK